jgi:hypothetical protein
VSDFHQARSSPASWLGRRTHRAQGESIPLNCHSPVHNHRIGIHSSRYIASFSRASRNKSTEVVSDDSGESCGTDSCHCIRLAFPAPESKPCDASSLPCAHHATTLRWKAENPADARTKYEERDLRSFDSGSTSLTLSLRLDGHSMTYVRRTILRMRPRLVCTIDVALRGLPATAVQSPHEISRCQLPCFRACNSRSLALYVSSSLPFARSPPLHPLAIAVAWLT